MIIWTTEEGEGQLSEWAEGQYATGGGGGASHTPPSVPPLESASLATVNEIRAAASSSQDPYPQWIYGALVSPEASTHSVTQASQGVFAHNHRLVVDGCRILFFV